MVTFDPFCRTPTPVTTIWWRKAPWLCLTLSAEPRLQWRQSDEVKHHGYVLPFLQNPDSSDDKDQERDTGTLHRYPTTHPHPPSLIISHTFSDDVKHHGYVLPFLQNPDSSDDKDQERDTGTLHRYPTPHPHPPSLIISHTFSDDVKHHGYVLPFLQNPDSSDDKDQERDTGTLHRYPTPHP